MDQVKIGKYSVELTHQDKELFPKAHVVKGELIDYYIKIAPIMVAYMKDRPLSMQRFPQGIGQEGFYQKEAGSYFPKWIAREAIGKKDGKVNYVMCQNEATLVYLANQLCITPHIWLSRIDKLDYPDRMIFDFDPSPGVGFAQVCWAAKQMRELLEKKLMIKKTFVMTTGSRGLHIVIPLKRTLTFEQTREFAHDCALLLAQQFPEKLTVEIRKAKRGKRVFIDWLRNAFGQTGVAPYAVRAKEGAPVATPIEWSELGSRGMSPTKYTIKNVFRRLAQKQDPWKNIDQYASTLENARTILDELLVKARLENK